MPAVAYAVASDTLIGVIRAWVLARARALHSELADDEATPLAIIGLDRQARVTGWNRMAEQMFGWSPEEVIGRFGVSGMISVLRRLGTSVR